MNRQTVFENLLSDLSSCLVSAAEKGIEANIHNALQNTLHVLGFQSLILFQYASDSESINMLHTACSRGVAQLPDHLDPSQAFPWCHDQLQQGRVVRINSLQDLPQRAVQDITSCRDHDIASVLIVPLGIDGGSRYAIAVTASHPMIWSRYRVSQVRLLGTVLFAVFQDVTRIEELERECRQLKEQLAHWDRVATVHAMSASLAHELSQPLFAILNNAQAAIRNMDRGSFDWREIRNVFREIESDDKRASSIVNRVRDFIRKREAPEHELLNLEELIREVVQMAQNELMTRKSRVEADIADNLPRIMGDRVQIQQVLINLLGNAMDAVQQCPSTDGFIQVCAWRHDGSARFSITDSGPGMDRATLTSAFKPFYSTKSHGVGLGLAVCRSIVTDHGGRIWAELPEHGRGLRAVVSIPAVAQGD